MIEWILEWSRLANRMSKMTKNVSNLSIKALNEANQSVTKSWDHIFWHSTVVRSTSHLVKKPDVKNVVGQKIDGHCDRVEVEPWKHLDISASDFEVRTAAPTSYMTLAKLLRIVMPFLCHFQQFYASRRQVSITGFLTKWFTGLDSLFRFYSRFISIIFL